MPSWRRMLRMLFHKKTERGSDPLPLPARRSPVRLGWVRLGQKMSKRRIGVSGSGGTCDLVDKASDFGSKGPGFNSR